MTANGVLQLAFYLIVLLVLAKPLGACTWPACTRGRPIGLDRALGWLERLIYRASGVAPKAEMGWKTYALTMLLFNLAGLLAVYALQRIQGVLPLNPAGSARSPPDSVVQHRRELRDEHQLAGLRRRDHHELSHADARADRAELHVGGDGHGGRGRADPRIRAPLRRDDRQLLGRSHADDALHPPAAVVRASRSCSSPRVSCRRSARTRRSRWCSRPSTTSR